MKLFLIVAIWLNSLSASGQITYDYYKNPEKIGSTTNPQATKSFIKAFEFIMQWGKEDADSAIFYLNKAIEQDSLYAIAYATLGHMMMYKGYDGTHRDFDSIKSLGLKALEINPECGDALTLLARITGGKKGLGYARKAVKAEPDHRETWLWLGMSYYDLNPDSAIYAFNKATEVDPTFGQGHQKLGWLYLTPEKKDYNQAAFHFRKMIDLYENFTPRDNRMVVGYEGLAKALIFSKQWDNAIDTLNILNEKCNEDPLLFTGDLISSANVDLISAYLGKSFSEFEKFDEWQEKRQNEHPNDNSLTVSILSDYVSLSEQMKYVMIVDTLLLKEKVLVQKIIDNNGSRRDLVPALFTEIFTYHNFNKYHEAKEELENLAQELESREDILPFIYYLLAINYDRMGDTKNAVKNLEISFKKGFKKVHMRDTDISETKDTKGYQKIIKKYS